MSTLEFPYADPTTTVHPCYVEGCTHQAYFERYCSECRSQIEALNRWAAGKAGRRRDWAAWARRWRWLPECIVVFLGLTVVGLAFAQAWIDFLGGR